MAIAFTVTVTTRDWDEQVGGWRCPPLEIPGAVVDDIFVGGSRVDKSWYEVLRELSVVRWVRSDPPEHAIVSFKLTEELSTQELTGKWKKLAIILPLMSSLLVAVIAGTFSIISSRQRSSNSTESSPSQQTRVIPRNISLNPAVQDFDWLNVLVGFYDREGAARQIATQGRIKFGTKAFEDRFDQSTKRFIWTMSTGSDFKLVGQAFRVTSQGLLQPLEHRDSEHSIEFVVPESEKGDKVVCVVRIEWTHDQVIADLRSILQSAVR